ncbi:MAG: nucleotide exchange factor GrpE [Anaerolineae bacterium]|nr:nucleotide exchange factor GrpE [Anaerolineae bacterium]
MTKEELDEQPPVDVTEEDADAEEPTTEEPTAAEEESPAGDLEAQVKALKEKLAETEKTTAEYLDGWQRAQASFANFRKRTTAEQAQWRSAANAALLTRLLPVLDDFKRAFDAVPDTIKEDPWLSGIRFVERKIKTILETENVQQIDAESGDTFDPNVHEAVLYQEVDGFNEGEIVAVVETGHMLADRVLRPSMVVVAKGTRETQPQATEEALELEGEESTVQGDA